MVTDTSRLRMAYSEYVWTEEDECLACIGHSAGYVGCYKPWIEVNLPKHGGHTQMVKAGPEYVPHHGSQSSIFLRDLEEVKLIIIATVWSSKSFRDSVVFTPFLHTKLKI